VAENDGDRLVEILLEEDPNLRLSRDVEHERAVAIFDIIQENSFALDGRDLGPYRLKLETLDNRLRFTVTGEDGACLEELQFPVGALRSVIRDYFTVCESYFEAVKIASPSKIEAIDMGRRALHNDGAEIVRRRLAPAIQVDEKTSRGLFTLICVLHIGGRRP